MWTSNSSVDVMNSQSVPHYCQLCLNHCVICWVFSCPLFCEKLSSKIQMVPKKQGKSYGNPLKPKRTWNVCNWSNKIKKLRFIERQHDLTKSWVTLWKNESCIHSSALNSLHSEHLLFFPNVLDTIYLWTPMVYCIC
jgi:hypothetical protein